MTEALNHHSEPVMRILCLTQVARFVCTNCSSSDEITLSSSSSNFAPFTLYSSPLSHSRMKSPSPHPAAVLLLSPHALLQERGWQCLHSQGRARPPPQNHGLQGAAGERQADASSGRPAAIHRGREEEECRGGGEGGEGRGRGEGSSCRGRRGSR